MSVSSTIRGFLSVSIVAMTIMTAPTAGRRSLEECQADCETGGAECVSTCQEVFLYCETACERRRPGDPECIEACEATRTACAATCEEQVNACKFSCPHPRVSPSEPTF